MFLLHFEDLLQKTRTEITVVAMLKKFILDIYKTLEFEVPKLFHRFTYQKERLHNYEMSNMNSYSNFFNCFIIELSQHKQISYKCVTLIGHNFPCMNQQTKQISCI